MEAITERDGDKMGVCDMIDAADGDVADADKAKLRVSGRSSRKAASASALLSSIVE
jgi:hypothetical protein